MEEALTIIEDLTGSLGKLRNNRFYFRFGSFMTGLKIKDSKRIKVKNPNYSLNSSLEKLQNIYRIQSGNVCRKLGRYYSND
jgi:hypothetical protein